MLVWAQALFLLVFFLPLFTCVWWVHFFCVHCASRPDDLKDREDFDAARSEVCKCRTSGHSCSYQFTSPLPHRKPFWNHKFGATKLKHLWLDWPFHGKVCVQVWVRFCYGIISIRTSHILCFMVRHSHWFMCKWSCLVFELGISLIVPESSNSNRPITNNNSAPANNIREQQLMEELQQWKIHIDHKMVSVRYTVHFFLSFSLSLSGSLSLLLYLSLSPTHMHRGKQLTPPPVLFHDNHGKEVAVRQFHKFFMGELLLHHHHHMHTYTCTHTYIWSYLNPPLWKHLHKNHKTTVNVNYIT